jgi:hypothetical protein
MQVIPITLGENLWFHYNATARRQENTNHSLLIFLPRHAGSQFNTTSKLRSESFSSVLQSAHIF